MLPWLRPPNFMPPPGSPSANPEDMAKLLRQNLLAVASNKPPINPGDLGQPSIPGIGPPNFLTINKEIANTPSMTRSSTPNTNEPYSPPPTLMPPPYHVVVSEANRSRAVTAASLLSAGRIPKADPMEGQLQDMLHYNMERCAGMF